MSMCLYSTNSSSFMQLYRHKILLKSRLLLCFGLVLSVSTFLSLQHYLGGQIIACISLAKISCFQWKVHPSWEARMWSAHSHCFVQMKYSWSLGALSFYKDRVNTGWNWLNKCKTFTHFCFQQVGLGNHSLENPGNTPFKSHSHMQGSTL